MAKAKHDFITSSAEPIDASRHQALKGDAAEAPTRRAIMNMIAGAAAMTAAAAVTIEPASADNGASEENKTKPAPIDWDQYELEIGCSLARVTFYDEEIAIAERAWKKWQQNNPWPTEPDYVTPAQRAAGKPRFASAQSSHCERYPRALVQSRLGRLKTAQRAEWARYDVDCHRIAGVKVGTVDDLKQKNSIARRFEHSGGPIHKSLVADILAI